MASIPKEMAKQSWMHHDRSKGKKKPCVGCRHKPDEDKKEEKK